MKPTNENSDIKLLTGMEDNSVHNESYEYRIKQLEGLLRKADQLNGPVNMNYEFAKQALKFQAEDLREQRRRESNKDKHIVFIITFSIFMFFAFTIIAFMMNKDEILADILTILAYVFGVGLTGYGIGLQKGKDKTAKVKA
ncbi:MAG: hypothetical protein ABIY50_03285 [Ignavibacteria bacterium]